MWSSLPATSDPSWGTDALSVPCLAAQTTIHTARAPRRPFGDSIASRATYRRVVLDTVPQLGAALIGPSSMSPAH